MTTYIGIDPGLTGAVAAIGPLGQVRAVRDTPTITVRHGKRVRLEYDVNAMETAIAALIGFEHNPAYIAIEALNARPGQGVTSMFRLGYGLGLWEGIAAAFKIPVLRVQPQRWKGAMLDGMGKGKGESLLQAQRLFPAAAAELRLKKHEGRAEALLIAEWLRRTRR